MPDIIKMPRRPPKEAGEAEFKKWKKAYMTAYRKRLRALKIKETGEVILQDDVDKIDSLCVVHGVPAADLAGWTTDKKVMFLRRRRAVEPWIPKKPKPKLIVRYRSAGAVEATAPLRRLTFYLPKTLVRQMYKFMKGRSLTKREVVSLAIERFCGPERSAKDIQPEACLFTDKIMFCIEVPVALCQKLERGCGRGKTKMSEAMEQAVREMVMPSFDYPRVVIRSVDE